MKHSIRFSFDKLMRAGIKLAMLTGVAFTVTACYGVPPRNWDNEAYEADTQQVEQQLVIEPEEQAE